MLLSVALGEVTVSLIEALAPGARVNAAWPKVPVHPLGTLAVKANPRKAEPWTGSAGSDTTYDAKSCRRYWWERRVSPNPKFQLKK
ncbi:MAG: hypothetical protein ACRERU_04175 [Methylococcales bacterium]